MNIERIEVAPLNLIPRVALTVAYGSYPVLEYALLRIHAREGIIGLGEASPDPEVTGETQESSIQTIQELGLLLEGCNPFNVEAILHKLEEVSPQSPAAIAAVDMALYDIIGKSLELPVYKILGGKVRDGMSLYPVVPMDEPQIMAAFSGEFAGMGCKILKLKVGSDPDEDEARLAAISEITGPEVKFRLDVNQGWKDAATAIIAIKKLNRFNIEYIEQPVAADDLDGMAAVTAAAEMPIMADETCHSPSDALDIVNKQAADIINIKLMKCGGIFRGMQIAAIAEAADIPYILGSMGESSIGSAAGMHLAVSRTCITDCELIGPLFLQGDPAVDYDADMTTGWAGVSETPGLGVEIQ